MNEWRFSIQDKREYTHICYKFASSLPNVRSNNSFITDDPFFLFKSFESSLGLVQNRLSTDVITFLHRLILQVVLYQNIIVVSFCHIMQIYWYVSTPIIVHTWVCQISWYWLLKVKVLWIFFVVIFLRGTVWRYNECLF